MIQFLESQIKIKNVDCAEHNGFAGKERNKDDKIEIF